MLRFKAKYPNLFFGGGGGGVSCSPHLAQKPLYLEGTVLNQEAELKFSSTNSNYLLVGTLSIGIPSLVNSDFCPYILHCTQKKTHLIKSRLPQLDHGKDYDKVELWQTRIASLVLALLTSREDYNLTLLDGDE